MRKREGAAAVTVVVLGVVDEAGKIVTEVGEESDPGPVARLAAEPRPAPPSASGE